jgi:hypothetical protein
VSGVDSVRGLALEFGRGGGGEQNGRSLEGKFVVRVQ